MEHLYVCHFSNGHIKVGRSIHPKSRIATHADRVACLGIELIGHHIAKCVSHGIPAEAELIEKCARISTKRNKSEWFEGLDYVVACQIADACARTPYDSPSHGKNSSPFKDYFFSLPPAARKPFAEKVGTSVGHLNNFAYGLTTLAPAICVSVEKESGHAVTRQELHANWRGIWPELTEPSAARQSATGTR